MPYMGCGFSQIQGQSASVNEPIQFWHINHTVEAHSGVESPQSLEIA
jgi:hypothetical protein